MRIFKNRWMGWCINILLIVVLGGCISESLPLPEDKKNYAGHWKNSNISLKISMDGKVNYKKEEGSRKTTIDDYITAFDKDNFIVGIWIMTTTFEVQKAPFREGERWAMVVEGNKLYKVIKPAGSTEA
jgi:hypothetical protein